jgi:hypothetical protein
MFLILMPRLQVFDLCDRHFGDMFLLLYFDATATGV